MLGKILATNLGLFLWLGQRTSSTLIQAFFIGILPIWVEVAISLILKVEPSQEKRKSILFLDAAIDAFSFLLVPAFWFYTQNYQVWPIAIFVLSGLWRLQNFLRLGLVSNQYFIGVPVTYMGYLWILVILIPNQMIQNILIVMAGFSMNAPFIKIKVTNYESS
jgi:hypothetical protein